MRRKILPLLVLMTFFFLGGKAYDAWVESSSTVSDLAYSQLIELIETGNIGSISIDSQGYVSGDLKRPIGRKAHFKSQISLKDEEDLTKRLLAMNSRPVIKKVSEQGTGLVLGIILLSILLIFILLIVKLASVTMKGRDFSTFAGKRGHATEKPKETFRDVAGVDEAKEELQDIVDFLANPGKHTTLGGRIPKGVLLIGPPGVGKTLLARAVAGEANVPFFYISGSEFVEMFVGVGASRVRGLFAQARKAAPCIIFIDEIDSLGSRANGVQTGGSQEYDQTLNQILIEMDGFESSSGVIVIAATNREDKLDPALLRPGRFDRTTHVYRPDVNGREQILKIHTNCVKLDENVNLKIIAKLTPGFTGADLSNLVNEAALAAAKKGKESVFLEDFEGAKDKIILGKENKSLSSVMTEKEKRTTAVHEAGHAIIALTMPESDPLHKVSIIPRGQALGITSQLPEDNIYNQSKEYLSCNVHILMGGRAAEQIILGRITAGAQNDIERATHIARVMVCKLGMSRLGPIDYSYEDSNNIMISEETQREIDLEIRKIIMEAEKKVKEIIEKHKDKLLKIVDALMEKETLTGEEIKRLIEP